MKVIRFENKTSRGNSFNLPKVWETLSGSVSLGTNPDDDMLNSIGLARCEYVNVDYDPKTQYLEKVYIDHQKHVEETWEVFDIPLETLQSEKIAEFKNRASSEILADMSDHEQRNRLAQMVQMVIDALINSGVMTENETITDNRNKWAMVKEKRDKSNTLEDSVKAAKNLADLLKIVW